MTLVIVVTGGILTWVSRGQHIVPVRPGGGACPTPLHDFPAGPDEDGNVFTHSFAAKRSYGSWAATVELGVMDEDNDFTAAGPKFEVDGCHWWSPWVKNRYIKLVDEDGGVLGSIDSDPFSWGWSMKVYDCHGQLTQTIEERRMILTHDEDGSDLTVAGADGKQTGTSSYEHHWVGTNKLVMTGGWGGGEQAGGVVAKATTPAVHLIGTKEWKLYAQGGAVGGAGDPVVIGAVASYKIWTQKKKKGDKWGEEGDFSGVCEPIIFWAELVLLLALIAVSYVLVSMAVPILSGAWQSVRMACAWRPRRQRRAQVASCEANFGGAVAAAALFGPPRPDAPGTNVQWPKFKPALRTEPARTAGHWVHDNPMAADPIAADPMAAAMGLFDDCDTMNATGNWTKSASMPPAASAGTPPPRPFVPAGSALDLPAGSSLPPTVSHDMVSV